MTSLFHFSLHYGITIPLSYHCPPTLIRMAVKISKMQGAASYEIYTNGALQIACRKHPLAPYSYQSLVCS